MAKDLREWRKSSYSGTDSNCVEVAPTPGATDVRDSKNPDSGELHVPRAAWRAFVQRITS